MEHEQFVKIVEQRTGLGTEAAGRAVEATLRTLAERLPKGREPLRGMPRESMNWLRTDEEPETFDLDEYLRRVADRESSDPETAGRHARAVFHAIGQAVGDDEIDALAADLPDTFEPLVAAARQRAAGVVPVEEFLATVARRGELDGEGARRATEAALETLAERITPREVEDLIGRLPAPLHEPLKRGLSAGPGKVASLPVEEFVRRIAGREGVPPTTALDHTRAALLTLRESLGQEFFDTTVRLPADYRVLWL